MFLLFQFNQNANYSSRKKNFSKSNLIAQTKQPKHLF